ncbi:MAG: ATP-dependent sacrificial sulfur transferase LarE [Thermoleophilaceae bacterium]|nr:ATP-dependent sacrificial sulfur transferase LarE [Thermoleophilaceae bacterium]
MSTVRALPVVGDERGDLRIDALHERLERSLAELESAVIAFSGGVDSSVVAALAARALGARALAVTAVSPALASGELEGARAVATVIGVEHVVITTDELGREGYRRNARDRCYHCKTELYGELSALASARGYSVLLSGANADDRGDWRPGLRAASEHQVRHPLLEAGAGKDDVRALARRLGVPSAEKPASPCLASRLPYGTRVEPGTLAQVDRAEHAVRALGYPVLRVRHHDDLGKLELPAADLERALAPAAREAIAAALREAGYARTAIDLEPLRSGSLNEGFRPPSDEPTPRLA